MIGHELFETGLTTRREVLGSAYVDDGLAASDDFMMAFQEAVVCPVFRGVGVPGF